MQRIQEHRIALGRVVRDDRLGADNRLVAELLSMYLDAAPRKWKRGTPPVTDEEYAASKRDQALFAGLLYSRFISKNGKVFTRADKDEDVPIADIEKEATAIERAAFEAILGSKT